MYAIIRDGAHQMRVQEGDKVRLAYREGVEPGTTLELDQVLLVGGDDGEPRIGAPLVEGAAVAARVTGHVKGDKIVVYKFKRRKNFHKKQGHRQKYTEAVVESIKAPGA